MKALEKKELRRLCKARISELPADRRTDAGTAIAEIVQSTTAYKNSHMLFIYVSTEREPDTRKLIKQAWADGKQVCVPKCLGEGEMAACRIESMDELTPGAMGLLEPCHMENAVPREAIDCALIPCVGAGRDGTRLGHGGGYYDRFLAGQNMTRLCLCFEAVLFETVPKDENDAGMDAVITENGIAYDKKEG